MSLVQFFIQGVLYFERLEDQSQKTPLKHTLGILKRGLDRRELSLMYMFFQKA